MHGCRATKRSAVPTDVEFCKRTTIEECVAEFELNYLVGSVHVLVLDQPWRFHDILDAWRDLPRRWNRQSL